MDKCVHEADISTYSTEREIPKAWLPAKAQGLGYEWARAGALTTLKFTRMWDHKEYKKRAASQAPNTGITGLGEVCVVERFFQQSDAISI